MPTIAVLGTLDSKGAEHAFVAALLVARGHKALLIDVGTLDPPTVIPDITREEVLRRSEMDAGSVFQRRDRGECVAFMSLAAPIAVAQLAVEQRIDAIISLGGGGGTAIATAAMRALPLGFPKVMVSTLAAGNVKSYVGTKDIAMLPSITDVAGLHRLSRTIFTRAAGMICGMVEMPLSCGSSRPLVVASMFGNTTACVTHAVGILEAAGYEVLIFAATGTGGLAMESLIESGMVEGVLDITTTEWADELVGGVLSAGPDRLRAAARIGVPAVIAPGCLDMVNFGERNSVPERFSGRTFYSHNPQITLMRTTPEECSRLGQILAERANESVGPVAILIPQKGISAISVVGGPFYDPCADEALFESIRRCARVPVVESENEINSLAFASMAAKKLLALMQAKTSVQKTIHN